MGHMAATAQNLVRASNLRIAAMTFYRFWWNDKVGDFSDRVFTLSN